MTNDQLHEDAVKLLLQRQRNATETTAKGCVKSYNQRRREATAALQPILAAIWKCLQNGESVGGFTSKEDWASSQSITIRQIQRIISGTPQKRHDVVLKVGMTVTVGGVKVVLTQALIDLLTIHFPRNPKTTVCAACGYKKCRCETVLDNAVVAVKAGATLRDAAQQHGVSAIEIRKRKIGLKPKVKTVACELCGYRKCQCAEIQAPYTQAATV